MNKGLDLTSWKTPFYHKQAMAERTPLVKEKEKLGTGKLIDALTSE